MGPTWGPPGSCRPQMGPMLAPWTLLSGYMLNASSGEVVEICCAKGQCCSHAYISRQQHRHGRQKYLTTQPYNRKHAISIYVFVGQCFLMILMGIDGVVLDIVDKKKKVHEIDEHLKSNTYMSNQIHLFFTIQCTDDDAILLKCHIWYDVTRVISLGMVSCSYMWPSVFPKWKFRTPPHFNELFLETFVTVGKNFMKIPFK